MYGANCMSFLFYFITTIQISVDTKQNLKQTEKDIKTILSD